MSGFIFLLFLATFYLKITFRFVHLRCVPFSLIVCFGARRSSSWNNKFLQFAIYRRKKIEDFRQTGHVFSSLRVQWATKVDGSGELPSYIKTTLLPRVVNIYYCVRSSIHVADIARSFSNTNWKEKKMRRRCQKNNDDNLGFEIIKCSQWNHHYIAFIVQRIWQIFSCCKATARDQSRCSSWKLVCFWINKKHIVISSCSTTSKQMTT